MLKEIFLSPITGKAFLISIGKCLAAREIAVIPDIGFMVGLYIITRMIVVMFDKTQRIAPKIFSGVTIAVALLCIADLISKGSPVTPPM
jgi:hypothetical protein